MPKLLSSWLFRFNRSLALREKALSPPKLMMSTWPARPTMEKKIETKKTFFRKNHLARHSSHFSFSKKFEKFNYQGQLKKLDQTENIVKDSISFTFPRAKWHFVCSGEIRTRRRETNKTNAK